MEEWKECRLGDILNFRRGYDLPKTKMVSGKIPVAGSNGIIGYHNEATPITPCITIGRSGNVGTPYIYKQCWAHNTVLYVDDFKGNDPYYLYYLLKTLPLASFGGGSAVPTLNRNHIYPIEVKYTPNLNIQKRIVSVLSSLDGKIQNNKQINSNLEEQAKALFKSWFIDFEPFKDGKFVDSELGKIPEGWKVLSLDEIADYLNGLAMQKYRPKAGEDHLPVLKIKELGQGYCDESCDICSSNVPSQYIVNDGDVIFSWSGTLMVDVWCGGRCGLNQHLFKVTSKEYPKWFYLLWTLEHLNRFIHIAKDKAVTMGHIKREELHKAKVVVPSTVAMNKANMIFAPIVNEMISTRISNRKLSTVRDTLLPKLMSGEIDV